MNVEVKIPGYDYGAASLPRSPVSLAELEDIKRTAGCKADDLLQLRRIGDIMAEHWAAYVDGLRQTLAQIPDAAKAARGLDGAPIPSYRDRSGARLVQGFKDLCDRAFDQTWLDYQYEVAQRHTSKKKNVADRAAAFPFVPLRYVLAHTACMVDQLKPYLDAVESDSTLVYAMLSAWLRALLIQVTLISREYGLPEEW